MASFNYKAKTLAGEVVTGRFDAADKNMVVSLLRNKGFYPIQITEDKAAGRQIKASTFKKVTTRDLAIYCRQFHTMINAGVSVLGCLDMLRKQTENRKLVEVTGRVFDDVQKGRTLSESMAAFPDVFPAIFTSMVAAGEVSGTLDSVLDRLSVHFEKENKMRQKIKTAMMYPTVIGVIALVMVVFMLAFIVPRFVEMFNSFGAKLPVPTRILLNISGTVTNLWFVLTAVVCIGVFTYLFGRFKKSEAGRDILDTFTLRLPLVGRNVRKILASRFTRTLSSLLATGVPLIQALEVVDRVVDNQLVAKGMVKVKEEIKRGSNLAGPLETLGIFPVMVTQMIRVGEESGALDSIMGKVADFYDDEVDAAISQLIGMLEPIMIMLIAVMVGSIVIAMVLPIFGMYSNVGQ
ncbi:MAG: type II secretion system F family protein [Clostridiales bacterium]|nr:type II secretion system F family protein [Eubacteriales bacterium]MDH7565259.1 type II secretion system F family protein [Clostridiales bacterium]